MTDNKLNIWLASEVKDNFYSINNAVSHKFLPLKELISKYLTDAQINDFIILPFVQVYFRLITKIRQTGIQGPVIFLTTGIENISPSNDLLENGILFLNYSHLGKNECSQILNFLIALVLKDSHRHNALNISSKNTDNKNPLDGMDLLSLKNFIDKHIKDELIADEDLNNPVKILTLFQKFKQENKLVLFTIHYFHPSTQKTVSFNLTALIDSIQENRYLVLSSIQPPIPLIQYLNQDKQFTICFDYGNRFYSCQSTVTSLRDDKVIVANLPNKILLQKRQYFRVSLSKSDDVKSYIKPDIYPSQEIELIDLSEKGISFLYNKEIESGVIMLAHIQIENMHILCSGVIKNKAKIDTQFRYGAEINPGQQDLDKLVKFIVKKQVELLFKARK